MSGRPPVLAHERFVQHAATLRKLGLRDRFDYIFHRNMWGASESRSGLGSSAEETEILRREVPALLRALCVGTLLDIPCGDFSWLRQTDLAGIEYIGADIVDGIVENNINEWGQRPGIRSFLTLDLTQDPLPKADLILCRDCLVHFSFARIGEALDNLGKSGSVYLLATTFPEHQVNEDIEDGDWRLLNLTRPPFNFPPPLRLVVEGCREGEGAYADKSLGLWRIADIPLPAWHAGNIPE